MDEAAVLALLVKVIRNADDYEWGAAQALLDYHDYSDEDRRLVSLAVDIVKEEASA